MKLLLKIPKKNKSECYLELLGPLNSSRVELLDQKRLVHQLTSLDRRVRSGRDIVDNFGSGGHDDLSNVVALVVTVASVRKRVVRIRSLSSGSDYRDDEELPTRGWKRFA